MTQSTGLILAGALIFSSPSWAAIQGLYGTECMESQGLSATKDLLFETDASRLEIIQTVYADLGCDTPAYEFAFSGPFLLDHETGFLDYTFHSIQMRVLDDRIVMAFNDLKLCGIDDWSLDSAREVSSLVCGDMPMPAPGLTLYDIVTEIPDGIQLGLATETLDGLSAEKRPVDFDAHIFIAR